MRCSLCRKPLHEYNCWKGTADRFYCSEFCADSETIVPSVSQPRKDVIDRQYLERLERLVPLRRRAQRSVAA